ncbi:MAG TPA: hypothetical protein VGM00_05125 [Bradyrhizobium sp.]
MIENIGPATANEDMRPVRRESHRHFLAEARSTTGHEDSLPFENVAAEHKKGQSYYSGRHA